MLKNSAEIAVGTAKPENNQDNFEPDELPFNENTQRKSH